MYFLSYSGQVLEEKKKHIEIYHIWARKLKLNFYYSPSLYAPYEMSNPTVLKKNTIFNSNGNIFDKLKLKVG